jgi:hypothetical protein
MGQQPDHMGGQIMGLEYIRERCTVVVCNGRNMKRLVDSDNFAIAYNAASKDMRLRVELAVGLLDKDYLRIFINEALQGMTPFHEMGVRALRKIAKNLRITGYWGKDKITLIKEIEDVVARLKEGSKQLLLQPKEGVDTSTGDVRSG